MPKSRFELPAQLPTTVTRPLYAGVGVTDLAVEFVREYVADVQKRAGEVQKTVTKVDYDPTALATEAQKRAQLATKRVTERVETLNKTVADDAQARRAAVEKRVAELQAEAKALPTRLQKFLDAQLGTAGDTYGELVHRGESLVDRIRRQQSTLDAEKAVDTTVAKAKTTRTQATKTASTATKSAQKSVKKSVKKSAATARKSPAKSSAKATATSAKKAAESTAAAVVDAAAKVGD
jgi:hypothetical protein